MSGVAGSRSLAQITCVQAMMQAQAHAMQKYASVEIGGRHGAARPRVESANEKRLRLLEEGIAELEIAWAPALARLPERLAA